MLSVCNNIRFVHMSRVIPTVHSLELYVYSLIKIIILFILQLYSTGERDNVVDRGSYLFTYSLCYTYTGNWVKLQIGKIPRIVSNKQTTTYILASTATR